MTRLLVLGMIGWVIGVTPGLVHGQGPPPRVQSCEDERDQLRILSRMLGDQRGQLELMVSEVLARAHRAEAEIARLKAAMTPPSEKK